MRWGTSRVIIVPERDLLDGQENIKLLPLAGFEMHALPEACFLLALSRTSLSLWSFPVNCQLLVDTFDVSD